MGPPGKVGKIQDDISNNLDIPARHNTYNWLIIAHGIVTLTERYKFDIKNLENKTFEQMVFHYQNFHPLHKISME